MNELLKLRDSNRYKTRARDENTRQDNWELFYDQTKSSVPGLQCNVLNNRLNSYFNDSLIEQAQELLDKIKNNFITHGKEFISKAEFTEILKNLLSMSNSKHTRLATHQSTSHTIVTLTKMSNHIKIFTFNDNSVEFKQQLLQIVGNVNTANKKIRAKISFGILSDNARCQEGIIPENMYIYNPDPLNPLPLQNCRNQLMIKLFNYIFAVDFNQYIESKFNRLHEKKGSVFINVEQVGVLFEQAKSSCSDIVKLFSQEQLRRIFLKILSFYLCHHIVKNNNVLHPIYELFIEQENFDNDFKQFYQIFSTFIAPESILCTQELIQSQQFEKITRHNITNNNLGKFYTDKELKVIDLINYHVNHVRIDTKTQGLPFSLKELLTNEIMLSYFGRGIYNTLLEHFTLKKQNPQYIVFSNKRFLETASSNHWIPQNLRPGFIVSLFNKYQESLAICPQICLPTAGWGDALVVAMIDKRIKTVVANDVNKDLQPVYDSLVENYNLDHKHIVLKFQDAATLFTDNAINELGLFGLMWLGLPFFNAEDYAHSKKGNKLQSHVRYSTPENWVNGWAVPLIYSCLGKIVPQSGVVLVNIGNTKYKSKTVHLMQMLLQSINSSPQRGIIKSIEYIPYFNFNSIVFAISTNIPDTLLFETKILTQNEKNLQQKKSIAKSILPNFQR